MEVIAGTGNVFQPLEIILHGLPGKGPKSLIGGTSIQCIGCMRQDVSDPVFLCKCTVLLHVLYVQRFGGSSSGIAGEKLKGIGSDIHGSPSHIQISFRRG